MFLYRSSPLKRLFLNCGFVKVVAENDVFIAIWGGFQFIVKGVIKSYIVVIVISIICIQTCDDRCTEKNPQLPIKVKENEK